MKNYIPFIVILFALLGVISGMVLDSYLTNRAKADILIACIQSDNCSESMKQELKPLK